MKTVLKYAAAAALTGVLAVAAVTTGQARDRHNAAAAIGFGAGALVGAAAASAAHNSYYHGPSYYEPSYVYQPGYVYEPSYAYEAEPVYVAPRYRYHNNDRPPCAIDMGYGKLDYGSC
jgi:hypothetical protein